MDDSTQTRPENETEPAPAAPEVETGPAASEPAGEETLARSSVIGFVLVPAMLVVLIVGIGWMFAYLTHEPISLEEYSRRLRDPNKSVRWKAALDLVENNQASIDLLPILKEMLDTSVEESTLVQTGWVSSDMLKKPEERKVNMRWYAAAALGKVGGEEAAGLLLPLVEDADAGVRLYAIHSLARIRDPRAVGPVITRLKSDEDPSVRMTAAWTLGELNDTTAVDPLREAWRNDPHLDVRWNSAIALARFCEEPVRDTLLQMTKADNANTRDQARRGLQALDACAKQQRK